MVTALEMKAFVRGDGTGLKDGICHKGLSSSARLHLECVYLLFLFDTVNLHGDMLSDVRSRGSGGIRKDPHGFRKDRLHGDMLSDVRSRAS